MPALGAPTRMESANPRQLVNAAGRRVPVAASNLVRVRGISPGGNQSGEAVGYSCACEGAAQCEEKCKVLPEAQMPGPNWLPMSFHDPNTGVPLTNAAGVFPLEYKPGLGHERVLAWRYWERSGVKEVAYSATGRVVFQGRLVFFAKAASPSGTPHQPGKTTQRSEATARFEMAEVHLVERMAEPPPPMCKDPLTCNVLKGYETREESTTVAGDPYSVMICERLPPEMCDEWQCPPIEQCHEAWHYDGRAACARYGEERRAASGSRSVETFASSAATSEVPCTIRLHGAPVYKLEQNGPVCGYGPEYQCPAGGT